MTKTDSVRQEPELLEMKFAIAIENRNIGVKRSAKILQIINSKYFKMGGASTRGDVNLHGVFKPDTMCS